MFKRITYLSLLVSLYSTGYANQITDLNTDKARYSSTDSIGFSFKLASYDITSRICITIFHLDSIISRDTIKTISGNNLSWKWKAPDDTYNGFLALFEHRNDTAVLDAQTIAFDIAKNWTEYPRYGFLSKYKTTDAANIEAVMKKLNRYHMNGIQFYDWMNKHHEPLPQSNGVPLSSWQDVAKNNISFNTVKSYVDACHKYNMNAMAYNLLYGAWDDASADGVAESWYIYKDQDLTTIDYHPLPSSWMSNIYLLNPANSGWQQYIINKTKFAFNKLNFDGWHIDQLGDRGAVYDNQGQRIYLDKTFKGFINNVKWSLNCPLVMNGVDQYGQAEIAKSTVDFLYSEVWSKTTFDELKTVITTNNYFSGNQSPTVIAGYMNYKLSNSQFNTASVLFADAVIFAHGGSHIELGEHMLHNEYFPNDNVSMTPDLENRLVKYYDFATAYERILVRGGAFETADVVAVNPATKIQVFPASIGSIAVVKRASDKGKVFHFINFTTAKHLNWRDDYGTQAKPDTLTNVEVKIKLDAGQTVKKIWAASPDGNGLPQLLNYTVENGYARLTIPRLEYWTMIVVDNGAFLGEWLSVKEVEKKTLNDNFTCYPNPFNEQITLSLDKNISHDKTSYTIYDLKGIKLSEGYFNSGQVEIPATHLTSGLYLVIIRDDKGNIGRKLITCIK